jgi:acetyl esterase/lipase
VRAIWDKELLKWAADQRFVLDRLAAMNQARGTPWFGQLNTDRVGAIGHSFGGAAATEACAEDSRIHASVNMDGWFFGAMRARGPHQPILVINASPLDGTTESNAKVATILDKADFADTEASLRNFGGYQLFVKGASHQDFTDQPLVSPLRMLSHRGVLPAQKLQPIVRAYVLAFFDMTLRDEDPGNLRKLKRPVAEISLEEWPAAQSKTVSSNRTEIR